jgi:hypothetical protein
MARVRTSLSERRAGRPGRRVAEGWLAFQQSSIWRYNETKKESRSTMGHRLWEKVWCQHKGSAPSSSFIRNYASLLLEGRADVVGTSGFTARENVLLATTSPNVDKLVKGA